MRYQKTASKISKFTTPLRYVNTAAKALRSGTTPQKLVLGLGLDYAKNRAEKYADKRYGTSKAYRLGKAALKGAVNVGIGDYLSAVGNAAQIYSEVDPNKKRVKKLQHIYTSYVDPTIKLINTGKEGRKSVQIFNK